MLLYKQQLLYAFKVMRAVCVCGGGGGGGGGGLVQHCKTSCVGGWVH